MHALRGIQTPDKPRQGAVRWPTEQVAEARSRLRFVGFTDEEAGDFLDYLAVVRQVRRLRAFMASLGSDELDDYHARIGELLGAVREANRTGGGR